MNRYDILPISWATPEDKARWYDAASALDARLPLTREFGGRVARAATINNPERICRDLHAFVRDCIRYVPDPKTFYPEETRDSDVTLRHGFEDCDGKARCLCALLRAAGMHARIRPVFRRDRDFVHVQVDVQWPGSERVRDRSGLLCAEPGGWLIAEVTTKGVQLGEDPMLYGERDREGRILYA